MIKNTQADRSHPSGGDGTSASPSVITSAIAKVIALAAMMEDGAAPDKPRARGMLTEKQVLAIVPIARSTLWRLEATGRFPKGVYIPGTNRKLYFEDEVRHWQESMEGQQIGGRCRKSAKTLKTAKQTA